MRSSLYAGSLSLFLVAFAALPADAEAPNSLANGDFASDYSGWTITDSNPGQNVAYWTSPAATPPQQGSTTGGSLNLTALPNSSITASQCVPITGNSLNASVMIYPFVTAGPSVVQVVTFGSANCSGGTLATIPLAPAAPVFANTWNKYQSLGTLLPQGTSSVRFELTVSDGANNSDGDYLFDNAQLDASAIFDNGFEIGAGITGNWFDPVQSGHGFGIEVLPGNVMLAEWYVFAPNGGQSWIVATGPIVGNTAVLQGFQPVGPGARFPPNFKPSELQNQLWGTITVTFTDCNNGRVSWQPVAADYTSGSISITRLTMPMGLTCT